MIFWADVPLSRGKETAHERPSPWLVVSDRRIHTRLPLVQAVPLTTQHHQADRFQVARVFVSEGDMHLIPNSNQRALDLSQGRILVLTEQVRALSHERLRLDPVARVKASGMAQVEAGLRFVFGIP